MNRMLSGHLSSIHRFLLRWLDRFPEDRLTKRVNGVANCALWQAGHIAHSRHIIANWIGCELERPDWVDLFTGGTSGDASLEWPKLPVIVRHLSETSEALIERLNAMDPAYLLEPIEHVLSDGQAPRGENVLFLLYHEGFHAGQVEQVRRLIEYRGGVE